MHSAYPFLGALPPGLQAGLPSAKHRGYLLRHFLPRAVKACARSEPDTAGS